MAHILISYSRKDLDFVRRLHEALEREGRETWVDWEGIPPSVTWMKEIHEAIDAADALVFVISPHSLGSRVCGEELGHALEQHKRLIPIVISDEGLDGVPPTLGALNWIYSRPSDDFEAGVRSLIEAVDTDFEWVKEHTRLLRRAVEWNNEPRNTSKLLRGRDLTRAEASVADQAESDPRPTALQRRYLLASRTRAVRNQRLRLVAVSVALLVTIVLAIVATIQRQYSERRAGAALALRLTQTQPMIALAHAVDQTHAWFADSVPEVRSALLSAIQTPKESAIWTVPRVGEESAPGPLPVSGLRASPRGFVVSGLAPMLASEAEARALRVQDASGSYRSPIVTSSRILAFDVARERDVVAFSTADGTVTLHDLTGSEEPRSFQVPMPASTFGGEAGARDFYEEVTITGPAHLLSLSDDGELVALGGEFGVQIRAWDDPQNPREVPVDGVPTAIALGASGDDGARPLLAVGLESGEIEVWDEKRMGWSHLGPRGRALCSAAVTSLAFRAADNLLVSGDRAGVVRRWEPGVGERGVAFQAHAASVAAVAFSHDGRYIVSGGHDNSARVWDSDRGVALGEPLRGHTSWIRAVDFAPSGTILTAGYDGTVRAWKVPRHPVVPPAIEFYRVRATSESMSAVVESKAGNLALWTPERQVAALPGETDRTRAVIATIASNERDEALAAVIESTDDEGKPALHLFVRRAGTDREACRLDELPRAIAVSARGDIAAVATGTRVELCDPDVGFLRPLPQVHTRPIVSLAFSPDGRLLATGSEDDTVQLWDVATEQPVGRRFRGHEGWVSAIAFSPDSRYIATGSWDCTVRLWDQDGNPMGDPGRGHADWVTHLRFDPDGARVRSWGDDRTEASWLAGTPDEWSRIASAQLLIPHATDGGPDGALFHRVRAGAPQAAEPQIRFGAPPEKPEPSLFE